MDSSPSWTARRWNAWRSCRPNCSLLFCSSASSPRAWRKRKLLRSQHVLYRLTIWTFPIGPVTLTFTAKCMECLWNSPQNSQTGRRTWLVRSMNCAIYKTRLKDHEKAINTHLYIVQSSELLSEWKNLCWLVRLRWCAGFHFVFKTYNCFLIALTSRLFRALASVSVWRRSAWRKNIIVSNWLSLT